LNIQQDNKARDFFIKGGYRTVPQLFVNDKLLCKGGSDGLVKMSKEDIKNRIKQLAK
jgi:glutaredoxin